MFTQACNPLMIERQHLAIVREVVNAGSITAAAERLGVSQSALSHSISKLEERQGARILGAERAHHAAYPRR